MGKQIVWIDQARADIRGVWIVCSACRLGFIMICLLLIGRRRYSFLRFLGLNSINPAILAFPSRVFCGLFFDLWRELGGRRRRICLIDLLTQGTDQAVHTRDHASDEHSYRLLPFRSRQVHRRSHRRRARRVECRSFADTQIPKTMTIRISFRQRVVTNVAV